MKFDTLPFITGILPASIQSVLEKMLRNVSRICHSGLTIFGLGTV